MIEKILYIVRGLPGSGKSTLARRLENNRSAWWEADMYFTDCGRSPYKFVPDLVKTAHEFCQRQVAIDMELEVDTIIVSNTFTRQWEMEPYREMARKYGYQVVTLTVDSGLTDDELAARNVHNVPVETIRKMRERWEH